MDNNIVNNTEDDAETIPTEEIETSTEVNETPDGTSPTNGGGEISEEDQAKLEKYLAAMNAAARKKQKANESANYLHRLVSRRKVLKGRKAGRRKH